jgi:hypothetical protein
VLRVAIEGLLEWLAGAVRVHQQGRNGSDGEDPGQDLMAYVSGFEWPNCDGGMNPITSAATDETVPSRHSRQAVHDPPAMTDYLKQAPRLVRKMMVR